MAPESFEPGIFEISEGELPLSRVEAFAYGQGPRRIRFSDGVRARVSAAEDRLHALMERGTPIYGVTTGFGDSCHRFVFSERAEALQSNLVAYLTCATGPALPVEATRAALLIRVKSLSLGFSGVSMELLERMALFLERDWIPVVPREGSLGASGDLIPLAYLAAAIQGDPQGQGGPQGQIRFHVAGGAARPAREVLEEAGVAPYKLKAKEGLAIVNGTSSMAGLALVNLREARRIVDLALVSTGWLCLALHGKLEAFNPLVNEKSKRHPGQSQAAGRIRMLLEQEEYRPTRGQDVGVRAGITEQTVQDRYSLRCAPQVLGPVIETLELATTWLEREINSASDNPLIDEDGSLSMGGNFYGGHLSHGMDYAKICLANVADLLDRQLMLLIDEKSNRGLTPNLADWSSMSEEERHLHHGLKGLHQSVSAITSGILAKAVPNSIFSRSSESHNQDKVSLGMTAAVQCQEMLEPLWNVQAMVLACLAQALDLRGISLKGESRTLYDQIRAKFPFVKRDQALGDQITGLSTALRRG